LTAQTTASSTVTAICLQPTDNLCPVTKNSMLNQKSRCESCELLIQVERNASYIMQSAYSNNYAMSFSWVLHTGIL